ncbi:hypothetical protein [Janthinobacterium sp. SUN137]|uniref:hypothetical protein n=1 Tax=Janthinobacterium sp. SUN137 TaxID=3014789 RepID=UPI0027132B7B|nr:hypothetical protein [Janthinobacterium sp. SUN137]MDO8039526.1 hypothetical protein [Janthinobacterium sp. SUN137]
MENNTNNKRTSIPDAVKLALREEVGFGCPVDGCGSPYLEYHHFDPPVNVRAHNDPLGMIALCPTHHGKADGGNYTNEQLHALKKNKVNSEKIKGDLDWLRNKLLAVVGGNYYYETPRIIIIDNHDVVSLNRDKDGYLRLTVNMLSILPEERLVIESHSWENIGTPIDLRCPPQGKELEVKYANGDYLNLRFIVLSTPQEAEKRYKSQILNHLGEHFPLTAVEVNMNVAGTNIEFSPSGTRFWGNQFIGNLSMMCGRGLCIENTGIKWMQNEIRKTGTEGGPGIEKLNYGPKIKIRPIIRVK